MTQTVKKWALESEFDAFLFAPIGEEKNGMLLSVLSALARLDIDPWREAAELARLPKGAANRRVTSLIEGLEIASPSPIESETVAARLVALLPSVLVSTASSETVLAGGMVMSSRSVFYVALFCSLLVIAMAGANWALASYDPQLKRDILQTAGDFSQSMLSPHAGD
jgi:hypothetical protein